ncbi:MAG: nitric oxide reductase activation protein NorD [Candidatus Binataceae bacterium]
MATEPTTDSHELFRVKGMLTKFMRMLFPLEFRIDSLPNTGPVLPFHYPLMPGEMIYLPDMIAGIGDDKMARDYYVLTASHLAARHEFGTFSFRLADIPGFEERGETGVEALDSYVSSFDDPGLAGALMRLCESARIDVELARRYRGLAPRITRMNAALAERLRPFALSTMLVRASLGLGVITADPSNSFIRKAGEFFLPLREAGATVTQSALATGAMYGWLQAMFAAAMAAGDTDSLGEGAANMRDDLLGTLRGAESGDDAMGGDDVGDVGGETDQQNMLDASGRTSKGKGSRPLSPEEIRKLIEAGVKLKPAEATGGAEGEGMYLTQLKNKEAQELDLMREQLGEIGNLPGAGRLMLGRNRSQDSYYAYDEWDYVAADYRRNWCHLREMPVEGDGGDFFERTLIQYAEMLPQVRRNFQRIRPASFRMVRGLEDGDELDFDRMIESRVMRRMGEIPDGRVYKARKKEARDVATLFLLDMSASTDEPIHRDPPRAAADGAGADDDWSKAWQRRPDQPQRPRRIIDVNKEALVIMAQALEEIGDAYAIMGFSGHGRDNVEFYVIKEFDHELSDEVKARVGAVEPKRSTRMGTAIRHVREKFKDVASRAKHVIMLSDGFPQDFDYGHDRRSNAYGIQDTMVALKELEMAGVLPFCITVDRTGHDYLRQMCAPSRYLVIEDITSLPRQLPKVYEQVVRW